LKIRLSLDFIFLTSSSARSCSLLILDASPHKSSCARFSSLVNPSGFSNLHRLIKRRNLGMYMVSDYIDRLEFLIRRRAEEELNHVTELDLLLDGLLNPNSEDRWCCNLDFNGGYSVRAAYSFLWKNSAGAATSPTLLVSSLTLVWKSRSPPKVAAFAWQLLQDRLPTRCNLFRRRVIQDQVILFVRFVAWRRNLLTICSALVRQFCLFGMVSLGGWVGSWCLTRIF